VNPYSLTVNGLAPDTFSIVSFRGREAMSSAYSFRVVAAALVDADDIERAALGQSAILMWTVGQSVRAFHGVLASLRVGYEGTGSTCVFLDFPSAWSSKAMILFITGELANVCDGSCDPD